MPGRLHLTRPLAEVAALVGAAPGGLADDPPRRNIAPGQEIATIVPGPAMRHMRWGIIPVGRKNARGRPILETIVNARSETVFGKSAFDGVGRCVVPADGWYEWTGPKGRKTAWDIRPRDGGVLWFAAICDVWRAPGGREVWQVATVTCPPNADVADIHDRMGVLLPSGDVDAWLHADTDAAARLLRTSAEGTLFVRKAEAVDWQGP